jgi:heme/copper-type cytochrome/quinol oxidase subunit 2
MKPLLFLANAFINTFGITQPSAEAADRAAKFIATLIGLVITIVVAIAGVAIYMLARH